MRRAPRVFRSIIVCRIVADSDPVNQYQETELNLPDMRAKIRMRDAVVDMHGRTPAQTSSMVD
ncbi:hypothetical protein J2785_000979 [Burkholderia ambifaria]|nr:hypothetical protein [Burkholderia ambifaria]MDR6497836.1 hypothetical protein [Burkholderia ambifaria]